MKSLFPCLGLIFLSACSGPAEEKEIFRATANFYDLPAPELGETWSSRNERQAEQILEQTRKMIQDRVAENKMFRRDAHPKTHGCVRAQVQVHPEQLPADLRVGLFAENKGYPAWIRFSNGAPEGDSVPDYEPDVRGMALKIMNARGPGQSHDLLMINSKEFFTKDGDEYMDLFNALGKGNLALALHLLRIQNIPSAVKLYRARVRIGNPLKQSYHSSTIYKLGGRSMRFKVSPCQPTEDDSVARSLPKDFLSQRLVAGLARNSACFKFYVQPNMEPQRNLTEDPRLVWRESASPYRHVATIRIPQQSGIDSAAQKNFCENVSFDPWRAHGQNRPLGQINRMRHLVYREIAKYRREQNRVQPAEPVNHTPCIGPTASLCQAPAP
jgi:hypothetical protein